MSKILGRWGVVLGLLGTALPAHAQERTESAPFHAGAGASREVDAHKQGVNYFDTTAPNGGAPKDMARRVGVDQNFGGKVPLSLIFNDENGKRVKLGDYFNQKKPVMLMMLQMTCDQLCSTQMETFQASLNNSRFGFTPGKEFEVVTVSLDPREGWPIAQSVQDTRADKKNTDNPASIRTGWHFLTATDTGKGANIKTLAKALGIRYMWDDQSKQYIHPDGVILATPDGQISRYFLNFQYGDRSGPNNSRDLRLSVMEASKDNIGKFSILDRAVLSCFHYNPSTGRYDFRIMAALRIFSVFFLAAAILGFRKMLKNDGNKSGNGSAPTRPEPGTRLKKA